MVYQVNLTSRWDNQTTFNLWKRCGVAKAKAIAKVCLSFFVKVWCLSIFLLYNFITRESNRQFFGWSRIKCSDCQVVSAVMKQTGSWGAINYYIWKDITNLVLHTPLPQWVYMHQEEQPLDYISYMATSISHLKVKRINSYRSSSVVHRKVEDSSTSPIYFYNLAHTKGLNLGTQGSQVGNQGPILGNNGQT